MLKRILPILLATLMLFSIPVHAAVYDYFPDVPVDAAYAEAVNCLAALEIVGGDNKGNFNPNQTITRAEFATIMVRMMRQEDKATATKTSKFSDVPTTHWACGYISVAVELGLVNGYGNGLYGPSDTLTYEQAVTVLVNMLEYSQEAQQAGGWPNGYIKIADQLNLTKNTNNLKNKSVSRSIVAILCFNSLSIPPNGWEGSM